MAPVVIVLIVFCSRRSPRKKSRNINTAGAFPRGYRDALLQIFICVSSRLNIHHELVNVSAAHTKNPPCRLMHPSGSAIMHRPTPGKKHDDREVLLSLRLNILKIENGNRISFNMVSYDTEIFMTPMPAVTISVEPSNGYKIA